MIYICLFLASLCVTTLGETLVTIANVNEKIRYARPTFLLIEELFGAQDVNLCYEKLFCLLETQMPNEESNPFKYYARFLTNSHREIDGLAFKEIETVESDYPKLTKIIEAIRLGQQTNNSQSCNQKYLECGISDSELIAEASLYNGDTVMKNGLPTLRRRGLCFWSKLGCGVLGGGCAICAVFTVGSCGVACGPVASVACRLVNTGCAIG